MAQPSVVNNLQVVSLLSQRRYIVQWSNSPETDVVSYKVFRSENQFDGYTQVGTVAVPGNQLLDTVPFTFGVNYFWKVTAVNSGAEESNISDTQAVSDISIGQFDEEPFKQVTVQKTDLVFDEIPGGLQNSSNVTFTTLFPFRAGTLEWKVNGLAQTQSGPNPDFRELRSQMGMTVALAPASTDTLRANYVRFFS